MGKMWLCERLLFIYESPKIIFMKRTADDICLLCGHEKATKKNSHIIPKFLGKSILGNEGSRKGFIIDSSKPHIKPKITQDSHASSSLLA